MYTHFHEEFEQNQTSACLKPKYKTITFPRLGVKCWNTDFVHVAPNH